MITTVDLTKRFDDFVAVDGVSLEVNAGEVLALLGPNGAGKTTTVRMLTSVLTPTRGTAQVAGFDVVSQAAQVRAAVGVLTENHGLYNRMPASDYLHFFGELYQLEPAFLDHRIHELLEQFGLLPYLKRQLGEYSKGMRQKLALARALLHNPPVLLLDEPTSAMDPESARLVRNAIHDLRSADRTIVICTHNLAEAEELADQIAIIRRGRIIAQGSPNDLKERLLGPAEYEIKLAVPIDNQPFDLPAGAELVSRGLDWVRFRAGNPKQVNPEVLRSLLKRGIPVVGLGEAPRSLEQVYLQAIEASETNEVFYGD